MRHKTSRVLFFLLVLLLAFAASAPADSSSGKEENIMQILRGRHLELLIEKGICDEQGLEIDGRLGKLISTAKEKGYRNMREVLDFVLGELNHSASNLGNFPALAFDRPIDYER